MPRNQSAARKTPNPKDPRQLAHDAVEKWFDSLSASPLSLMHGTIYSVTLEAAFDEVIDAIEQEHRAERTTVAAVEPADREAFATEAGYLIGVQVGLRLRAHAR